MALNFINGLAPSLRRETIDDPVMRGLLGLERPIISLGAYQIFRDELLEYVRAVVAGDATATLRDRRSLTIPLTGAMEPDGSAVLSTDTQKFRIDTAALLSQSEQQRLSLFDALMQSNTCPPLEEQHWRARVSSSVLSDSDLAKLEETLASSVERTVDGIRRKIDGNSSFTANEWVPKQTATFYTLLGEPGNNLSLADYVENVCQPRWEVLLGRDLVRGLQLIGPSCVTRHKVLLTKLLAVESGSLHAAFETVLASPIDPFTVALILDVCASKFNSDARFIALGRRAIERLTGASDDPSILNFAIAVPVILNELAENKTLNAQPVFFRRLVAWTWSGIVARILAEFEFDRGELLATVERGARLQFSFIGSRERREVPSWRPEWLSIDHLRGLLRRRVGQALGSLQEGQMLPDEWSSVLDDVDKRSIEARTHVFRDFPGPFDQLAQSDFQLMKDSVGVGSDSAAGVAGDGKQDAVFLAGLQQFVNIFEISPGLLSKIRASAERLRLSIPDSSDTATAALASLTLSHLAGLHRDSELSDLAVKTIRDLTIKTEGDTSLFECHVILDAACGYADELGYRSFVRDGIERLSYGPLTRSQGNNCLQILDAVSRVDPGMRPYLGRAGAGLRLAARHAKE